MRKQKRGLAKISSVFLTGICIALASMPSTFGQWNKSTYDSTKLPKRSIYDIIGAGLFWLLAIFGFIAIIGFAVSGIMYLTAAGDEDRQETAKNAMFYSITGVIVGLVGLVVIYAVDALLNATGNI